MVGPEEELTEVIKVPDRDDRDPIGVGGMRYVMFDLGEKLADEEVGEMIRRMSVDGNGPINHEELVKVAMANGRGTLRVVRMPRTLPSWRRASVCPRPIHNLCMAAELGATSLLEEKAEGVNMISLSLPWWADGLVESRAWDEWWSGCRFHAEFRDHPVLLRLDARADR